MFTSGLVRLTDKMELHGIKIGVWCVVGATRIIGRVLFSDTT
jgi:hypothetical protein